MTLTVSHFALITLLAAGGLMLLAATVSRALHARVERRALSARRICRLCLYAFEDPHHARQVDCPQCGAANEKPRSHGPI